MRELAKSKTNILLTIMIITTVT